MLLDSLYHGLCNLNTLRVQFKISGRTPTVTHTWRRVKSTMIETLWLITAKAKTAIRTNACIMTVHLKENRQKSWQFFYVIEIKWRQYRDMHAVFVFFCLYLCVSLWVGFKLWLIMSYCKIKTFLNYFRDVCDCVSIRYVYPANTSINFYLMTRLFLLLLLSTGY